nr:hypothetical protein GCM10020092_004320 [Actinoplanes digitatis]
MAVLGRHGHTYQDRTSECGSRERDAQWTHEIPRIDRRHRRGQPSLIFAQKKITRTDVPPPSRRNAYDSTPTPGRLACYLLPPCMTLDGWSHEVGEKNVRRRLSAVLAAVLLSVALPTSALAETTTPGDPNGRAFASDAIKAITWNMCGEGGGSTPAKSGYCPDRNKPQAKADALGKLVRSRGANVVLLQEVCASTLNNAERGKSLLTLIQENLGSEWSFEWEPTTRAGGSPETHCRGALSGTYATAIGVRGTIASHDSTSLQQPMPDGHLSIPAGQEWSYVLCAKVTGWQTRICNAHLTNYDKVSNPDAPPSCLLGPGRHRPQRRRGLPLGPAGRGFQHHEPRCAPAALQPDARV